MDPFQTAHQRWQTARLDTLTGEVSNLTLDDVVIVKSTPTHVAQLQCSATWDGHSDGVTIATDAQATDPVTIDGKPVAGNAFVGRLRSDGTPLIRCGPYAADAFSLDGSSFELRIYNAHASRKQDFRGIEYYEYDPQLRVAAQFAAYDEIAATPWEFTKAADAGRTKKVPGKVQFTLHDTACELLAFLDGDTLVITFADATTGHESYPPGRFLRLDSPDETGRLTIDFNYSFIPPCGFSYYYSCPLPPPGNRLSVPVRGGEKTVRWADEA